MPDLKTIPGFAALQSLTLGDPRIKIAVIDGSADLDRACFQGAHITRVKPYWQESLEPIDPFYIQQELKIRELSDRKKTLKKTKKALEKQQGETTLSLLPNDISDTDKIIEPIAQTTASASSQLLGISTIFNTLLELVEAPTLEQYQQRKSARSLALLEPPEQTSQQTHSVEPPPSIADLTTAIQALETEIEALKETIPKPVAERLGGIFHATGIFGTMFGQPGSPVAGVAPYCTAINIPLFETATADEALSPLHLAHAFNLALDLGVNIIHCAACHPTQTGFAHEMIQKAVKQCQDNNILIVAPSGNNKGECFCVPAVLPNVMAVGMMKDDGQPANYSNWGGQYQHQGILAPGENIVAAQPGTDNPARQEGTSLSAPFMTGISALLMSLQLQRGEQPNAEAVRQAFLNSAIPCNPGEVAEPDRCLAGKLNIPGAYQRLTGQPLPGVQASSVQASDSPPVPHASTPFPLPPASPASPIASLENTQPVIPASPLPPDSLSPSTVAPRAVSNSVYVLGNLGYDFGSAARCDIFKQSMPTVEVDGSLVPANPYDAQQMVNYLAQSPAQARSLIWTLNQELNPIYALEPQKAFATEIYEAFQLLLAGQIQPQSSNNYIERISIPGILTDRTVELLSGQVIPVLRMPNVRGIFGWSVNILADAAIASVSSSDEMRLRRALSNFLKRVYYDLRNSGQLDRERALNFAVTNAFQAASTFAEAISTGMELDTIEVEKSPFCRLDSNCWDIKLRFYDPENGRRAKKIFRFTIDVKDTLPVTLGQVKAWSVAHYSS